MLKTYLIAMLFGPTAIIGQNFLGTKLELCVIMSLCPGGFLSYFRELLVYE